MSKARKFRNVLDSLVILPTFILVFSLSDVIHFGSGILIQKLILPLTASKCDTKLQDRQ